MIAIQAYWLRCMWGELVLPHYKKKELTLINISVPRVLLSYTSWMTRVFPLPQAAGRVFNYCNTAVPVLLQHCKAVIKAEKAFSFQASDVKWLIKFPKRDL